MKKILNKREFMMASSRNFLAPLCLIFVLLLTPFVTFAVTLAQYREKIQNTQNLVDELNYLDQEELTSAEYSKHERAILLQLRQSLAPAERVEWEGGSLETNNKWLQEKLDEFEKEAEDSPRRTTILAGISERLSAIGQKIDELENPPVSGRTKDEDKRKLSEILERQEYQKPEVKESLFERIMKKIKDWFGKSVPRPQIPQGTTEGFKSFSLVLQILLYSVILAAIGFLIYRFAPYFVKRFREREKREKKDRLILGERVAANESADNLFSEAERLAREGNLRGAIRKGFIALLCELSDRKIIGLSQHKTNRDYLRDVRKRQEIFEKMNDLTLNYERHWYGSEKADEKDWEDFKNGYRQTVNAKS